MAAGGDVEVASLRQATGSSDEMGQASLALVDPVLIDAIAIADQDALPIVGQGHKGVFGAVGINAIVGYGIGGHDPEPLQGVLAVPGCFINGAHRCLVSQSRNGLIVGHDGLRDPMDDLLHRAQADGDIENRVTEVLDESPRGTMRAGECSDEGAQARAIPGLMLAWHLRFELPATSLALALLEDEMVDLHLDGRQLDDLMGVIGCQRDQVAMATRTGAGRNEMDVSGTQ